jgi:large subunit ribosomal protein L24
MLARSLVAFAAAADAAAAAPKFIPITQLNTRQVRSGQQRPKKYDMLKEEDKLGRWRILRGDRVQVIAGDAKGETGVVKRVVRKKNMVLVENANMRTRIFKPNPEMRGRKFKREGLIHVSNVMLVDPKEKKPTRVKAMFTPSGRKLRVSKKSCSFFPCLHFHICYSEF